MPWSSPDYISRTQILLDSYERFLGKPLIQRSGDPLVDSQRLNEAQFVVVAHGTQADPVLNYGNAIALELWEMSLDEFHRTPSRLTAEPMHRDERACMLERTRAQGFIDDYRGVRISKTGRRFLIEQATVWNLVDANAEPTGQAATFSHWNLLPTLSPGGVRHGL